MAGALPACGGGDEEATDTEPQGTLEVFSWWVQGGEGAAFDALVAEFNNQYPKVNVVNAALENAEQSRMIFQERMTAGDPPDTFQSGAAAGLFQWVGDGDAATSKLLNLEPLAGAQGWKNSFSEEVRSLVTLNDRMWAVPVNVHRINAVLYNPTVLASVGEDAEFGSLDEMIAACELLDADGIKCLSIGAAGGWTQTMWFMDGIFPAAAGDAEYTRSFLRGELSGDDPLLIEAVNKMAALLPYTNADRGEIEWDVAAEKVKNGEAAFSPMGDWAYAEMKARGGTFDTDINVMGHPGGQNYYVMNFDTFPVPAGAKNQTAAEAWLKVVGSEEGQNAFNVLKGSIPARTVVDTADYDQYGVNAIGEFAAKERVRAMWTLVPPALEGDMNEVFRQFVLDGDVDTVLVWFSNNYSRFGQ